MTATVKDNSSKRQSAATMEPSTLDGNTPVEKHKPPYVEQNQKQSRQQKKVGKQKIKERKQEEQLKLAKSVINNLERKLGEVENSNKLMKQERNLLKSGAGVGEGEGTVTAL